MLRGLVPGLVRVRKQKIEKLLRGSGPGLVRLKSRRSKSVARVSP